MIFNLNGKFRLTSVVTPNVNVKKQISACATPVYCKIKVLMIIYEVL